MGQSPQNNNSFSPESNINLSSEDKGSLELKTQEFMPTIIIGLGGTGKEVLLRLRRQFVEKYGSLDDFPILSYLYIDTDNAPTEEGGLAREQDYLINDIEFQPAEKIFNPVNPSDYIHKIHDVPHIKQWLNTTGEIGKLGTMNTGAGQIRPAARLALYHNYDEIVSKLTSAKSRITDSKSINLVKDKHKIKNVNTDKINVYVITSVSGGTGSGIFVDFGFIIRNIFKNAAVSSCYVVLPQIFQSYGKERVYANGYAALKELEHYNLKNVFDVSWKKNFPHTFQPGVYDDVYLIDGENSKNLSLSDISNRDIYKMLSDTIFQDFSNSDFANYKRGVRVNLVQYKQRLWPDDNTVTENTYSRKYSTLGQATISIPIDRITLSCAYKLCEDIINYYLTFAEGSQSDIDTYLMDDFLPSLGILESNNKHQLLESLYSIGEKSSIPAKIKGFLNALQNELVSGKRGMNWSAFILAEVKKFDTNFKDDNDVLRQGMYYSQIHSNRTNIMNNVVGDPSKNMLGGIEKQVNSLVNDSTRGVFYGINVLRRLQFILSNENFNYIPRFEKDIQDLQIVISKLDSEVKRRFQDLREDESMSKVNMLKKAAMTGTLEKLIKTLDEYYNALVKIRARYYAKEICERILNIVEKGTKTDTGKIQFTGLIADLEKLTGNLGVLKENFQRKYKYFSQKQNTSFNLQMYEPEDIKNEYYVRYIGTGQNAQENIKSVAYKLLKELNASDVTDIVNILRDSDAKVVEERMVSFAKRHFERIKEDYNITEILFEKDPIRSESKIRGMFLQAFPWLRIKDTPGSFKLEDSAKKYYIGIRTNTPSFRKFQNLIRSIAGSSVEFKDSADNSSITFYSEWAGFPLFYSYTIAEEMKPYYKQLTQNQNIDLHTDKNHFLYGDIIPLTTEERLRLDESYRAYLMGLIFGVFDVVTEIDKETGKPKSIYKYTLQEGITVRRVEQLGVESRVINRLFEEQGREAIRYKILKDAEAIQSQMYTRNCLPEMLVIFEYYYENIYNLQEVEISGDAKIKLETYEYSIAKNLAREIESKVHPDEREEFINKVIRLKNNMDSFTELCGDGMKRVLKVQEILTGKESELDGNIKPETITNGSSGGMNINRLKELKLALDEGLITEEEYNKAKQEFLKVL